MNKIYLIFFFTLSICLFSQVNVRGYYRKDGTYVRPHVRTYPNNTVTDNYSYPGNYNPNLEYNKLDMQTKIGVLVKIHFYN